MIVNTKCKYDPFKENEEYYRQKKKRNFTDGILANDTVKLNLTRACQRTCTYKHKYVCQQQNIKNVITLIK